MEGDQVNYVYVEFWTGKEWKRWNGWFSSTEAAREAIEEREKWADHIKRRIV